MSDLSDNRTDYSDKQIELSPTTAPHSFPPISEPQMKRLLIAEDSKTMRDHLTELISEIAGLELVGQAMDVPSALQAVRDLKPDVLVLDLSMPGGSALDVLALAKKEKPSPIVVLFTQHSSPQYRARFLEAGADAFFSKSTEFAQLIAFLRKLARPTERPQLSSYQRKETFFS